MLVSKRLLTLAVFGISCVCASGNAIAQEPYELKPNIRAADAFDVRLSSDGTRLRFSTLSFNIGAGPLEIIGGETGSGIQNVYQRVYLSDGSYYDRLAGKFEHHPEHGHIHFGNYATYTLQEYGAPGGARSEGQKTTFCLLDTDLIDGSLPGSPPTRQYTSCSATKQGISVGWGDTYRYYLAGQDLDVTGFASGDYELTIDVDPNNRLLETNDTDNTSLIYVNLNFESDPPVATVINQPGDPGDPPAPPVMVSSIWPDSGVKNSIVYVTIMGSGFAPGMPVIFENGAGRPPVVSDVNVVDSSTITATVTIKKGGKKRPSTWDLRVGNGRLAYAFTVDP